MNRYNSFLALVLLIHQSVLAQQPPIRKVETLPAKQRLVAGLAIPLASFSETHFGGSTISYIRFSKAFKDQEPYQRKKTGWLAAATVSHYLGKKENNGMVAYRYKGYSVMELNAGAAWYPVNKLDLSLRTGPALGYYNKIIRFTLTGHLQGSYRTGPKTIITPGISLIKEPGSDALWVTSLQLGIVF